MLVASDAVIRDVQACIALAVRHVTNDAGVPVSLPTIEANTLRMAAVMAIQMCAGQVVWDGARALNLTPRKPAPGAVEIVETTKVG